jgi:leucine dehydrogenase
LAGLPLGGGKAVIIGNPHTDKSPALFKSFGRFVDSLGGRYITAEDVGTGVDDMEIAATETEHVVGLSVGKAASGDPSPWTALGVFRGIEASVRERLNRGSVGGLTVAVQGLGNVGFILSRMLLEAGALVIASDVHEPSVRRAVDELGIRAIDPDSIFSVEADVFAPCALGTIIDDKTIGRLKVKIVAGAANNQLALPRYGEGLGRCGILYAPDYVINAGGVISVAAEALGETSRLLVPERVNHIAARLGDIFAKAARSGEATNRVADAMAEQVIASAPVPDAPAVRLGYAFARKF